MNRPRTTCCWCGTAFWGRTYHSEAAGDYCSEACYEAMVKDQNDRDDEENPDGDAEDWAEQLSEEDRKGERDQNEVRGQGGD